MKEKIRIQARSRDVRLEHVQHFRETLDDRDLDKQLTLLRLEDADEMKETLRAYQRIENIQVQSSTGSKKFRSRPTP